MTRLRTLGIVLLLLALMGGFGVGVNRYIASRQTEVGTKPVADPVRTHTDFVLPGTVYLAQQGGIYALNNGSFRVIRSSEGWTQVSLSPDGTHLFAVKQVPHYFSDLYMLSTDGTVLKQLTNDGVKTPKDGDLSGNRWAFYPRQGDDGKIYFSFDKPKAGFQVDLAVWNSPLDGFTTKTMKQRTQPNQFTGGDVSPIPLTSGALIYVKYQYGTDGQTFSRIMYQNKSMTEGTALTKPEDNCFAPSLSSTGMLAFVCSANSSVSEAWVGQLNEKTRVLENPHKVVTGTLVASPSWSPDGKSLLYLAPTSTATGYFELWWLDRATEAVTAAPRAVTTQLDFDATSAAVWSSP
ncbi:MAG: hypothetical protein ACR2GX_00450 [Candidatus Dormibacteria bacterium]